MTFSKDSSENVKTYQLMHPWFIVEGEIGESTKARRGRLTDKPHDHVHHQVVTGPIGDPLTSFCSHKEFVQVLLDCIKSKSGYFAFILIKKEAIKKYK